MGAATKISFENPDAVVSYKWFSVDFPNKHILAKIDHLLIINFCRYIANTTSNLLFVS